MNHSHSRSLLLRSLPQDYHVFFMHCLGPNRCLVYDLDTTLPFPTYFHKYVTETFRSDFALRPEHHRWVNEADPQALSECQNITSFVLIFPGYSEWFQRNRISMNLPQTADTCDGQTTAGSNHHRHILRSRLAVSTYGGIQWNLDIIELFISEIPLKSSCTKVRIKLKSL